MPEEIGDGLQEYGKLARITDCHGVLSSPTSASTFDHSSCRRALVPNSIAKTSSESAATQSASAKRRRPRPLQRLNRLVAKAERGEFYAADAAALFDAAEYFRAQAISCAAEPAAQRARGTPYVDWTNIRRVAARRAPELLRKRGIKWVSVGFRECDGVWTDEPCVVAYVGRKLRRATLGQDVLPRNLKLTAHRRIAVDVVAVGKIRRTALAAVGARVMPTGAASLFGTLGVFVRSSASGTVCGLTAGHVLSASGPNAPAFTVDPSTGNFRVLGSRQQAFVAPVDVGAVELVPSWKPKNALPNSPPFRGFRRVYPGEAGETFQTFGARTGRIVNGILRSPEAAGVALPIASPILLETPVPVERGDSGAVLVDLYGYVAGLLHGFCTARPELAVFTPIKPAMEALQCEWDGSLG